jgi:hypothetical protein
LYHLSLVDETVLRNYIHRMTTEGLKARMFNEMEVEEDHQRSVYDHRQGQKCYSEESVISQRSSFLDQILVSFRYYV